MSHRERSLGFVPLAIVFCLCAIGFLAWSPKPNEPEKKRIILEHADLLNYDANYSPDIKRLVGNVKFRHGIAVMKCDSAYLNERANSFEGFGRIHIQEDTVNIYAKHIDYDGFLRLARLRHEVSLDNGHATLYTDSLDYDRNVGLAYYFNGGTIVDSVNTLSSGYGQYDVRTEEAEFQEAVSLENENFVMETENLHYSTKSHIATMLGPTTIVSDSGRIVTTRGVYDTQKDVGILLNGSTVHSRGRSMTGDSIYYDSKQKWGEVFGSMHLIDTTHRADLYGQYGYFDEKREYAFAAERARAVDYSRADTLHVGADTLEMISYKDRQWPAIPRPQKSEEYYAWFASEELTKSTQPSDSQLPVQPGVSPEAVSRQDTVDRYIIRAYRNVRAWRRDAQAVADSLEYSSADSLIGLFGGPVLWSEENQLSADTIHVYLSDSTLEAAVARSGVIGMQQIDTMMYNQLSSQKLNIFFQDSTARFMEALDSVESIFYFAKEGTKQYYAMNRMKSDRMFASFANDSLQKVKWVPSWGKVYPIKLTDPALRRLPGFGWKGDDRPSGPDDIFRSKEGKRYRPPSLRDLSRFRGADAALLAYRQLELKLLQRDSLSSLQGDIPPSAPLEGEAERREDLAIGSPSSTQTKRQTDNPTVFYPLRSSMNREEEERQDQNANKDPQWLYFKVSTDLANPGLSTINPSIGIPKRKNWKSE